MLEAQQVGDDEGDYLGIIISRVLQHAGFQMGLKPPTYYSR